MAEDILEKILSEENLQKALAFTTAKAPQSYGIDEMKVADFSEYFSLNKNLILTSLRDGTYSPKPVIMFEIIGKNGKKRPLAKYAVIDRFVTRAVHQVLTAEISPGFSEYSFAYQEGKGTLDAVRTVASFVEKGMRWMAEIDIENFFGSIPHEKMIETIRTELKDRRVTDLLIKYMTIQVYAEGETFVNSVGLIQGNPLSPLLSNMYLNNLDKYCTDNNICFIRFADDIRLFAPTYEAVCELKKVVCAYITEEKGLHCSTAKGFITPILERNILGYKLSGSQEGIVVQRLSRKKNRILTHWQSSALQFRENAYHIVGNGILTKKDFALLFENEEKSVDLPVECIDSINIYSDIVLSGNFFSLASQKHLRVNFFDKYGNFIGCFEPEMRAKSLNIPLRQLIAYEDPEEHLFLAKAIITAGIHNMGENIRYYQKRMESTALAEAAETLRLMEKQIGADPSVGDILLHEAQARKAYYAVFHVMISDEEFALAARSKRPPKDAINALISFGNTFLYSVIRTEIDKSSLDGRISFLHSPQRRTKSLYLDLSEIFKPIIVDRVIFSMINMNMLSVADHFEGHGEDSVYLNYDGKVLFISKLREKLKQSITVGGNSFTYFSLIQREVRNLMLHFSGEGEYHPFRYY